MIFDCWAISMLNGKEAKKKSKSIYNKDKSIAIAIAIWHITDLMDIVSVYVRFLNLNENESAKYSLNEIGRKLVKEIKKERKLIID